MSSMGATERRYGYKASPQVSASQIAEYLLASPTRRKSIIRDARFPKTSIIAQYGKAREGLVNFLDDGTRSFRHLADATDYLTKREHRTGASDWLKRDSRASLEAIDTFQRAYNRLGFRKLDCRRVSGRQPHLELWPTKISVDLDLTIHKPVKDEKDHIGGAIFLFSKGESSNRSRVDRSKTIAGLIYTYCQTFLAGLGDPDRNICLAVDVFGQNEYKPSGTFARKLDYIGNACEEIAARWQTVAPPADYDGPDPG